MALWKKIFIETYYKCGRSGQAARRIDHEGEN